MNYYVRFPSKENMKTLSENCAEFKSILIVEKIKKLNIPESEKKKVFEHVQAYLKENLL